MEFNCEDLLDREPVRVDEFALAAQLAKKTVVVTGGAGSIGSELCRQLVRLGAERIVAFDFSEAALFQLARERHAQVIPVVGNVQNAARLHETFARYRPALVFHAAAYKHVSMMEANAVEAVENNIFGTWNAACAAKKNGVDTFVLLSSDKAVRPASVMGATKRIAEILTQSNGIQSLGGGGTKFMTVRFGNVLGSSGSVVPIFAAQIAAGGPVTITHPEMRRYFLTLREAAQLILHASTMGGGGERFIFETGAPVWIVDLAKRMIALAGRDVNLQFTGAEAGEKLCEELSLPGENSAATDHPNIRVVRNPAQGLDPSGILRELRRCSEARDSAGLLLELSRLIPDFEPSGVTRWPAPSLA